MKRIIIITMTLALLGEPGFSSSVHFYEAPKSEYVLAPVSSVEPIAVLQQINGTLEVLEDGSEKQELTRKLGERWGFIYLNRFIAQVLKDYQGKIKQEDLRKICKAHFVGHPFVDINWWDIYKTDEGYYVRYVFFSEEEQRNDLLLKYNYRKSDGVIDIKVFTDVKLLEQFKNRKDILKNMSNEEKEKAEMVFQEIKKIVQKGYMDAIGFGLSDQGSYISAYYDKTEEYRKKLEKINSNNPIFSPEAFAETFVGFYPEVSETSMNALKYILESLGQEQYVDTFERAYKQRVQNIIFPSTGKKELRQYLNQLRFVPEMSKSSITEKSLSVMEYLNEELDFVDPIEFKKLKKAARIIENMAVSGVRFDEKKGSFINFINHLYSIVMSEKKGLTLENNYRISDCLSSGRPRFFPGGGIVVESEDLLVYEIYDHGEVTEKTINLNSVIEQILRGGSHGGGHVITDKEITSMMDKWFSGFVENMKRGEEFDKDILEMVRFFRSKKNDKLFGMNSNDFSGNRDYTIDDPQIKALLEVYLKRKLKQEPFLRGGDYSVRVKEVRKQGHYLIGKLMERLENRIMSAEFKEQHPILQAAEIYLEIIDIHPFIDGNERMARLFMNYYLIVNNLPVLEIYPDNREAFIKAVRFVATKDKFAMFLAKQLIKQNHFMLEGNDAFHHIVSAEEMIEEHLDILSEKEDVHARLYEEIKKVVDQKETAVIMTSFGLTLQEFYSRFLVEKAALEPGDEEYIDLKKVTFVLTDEFVSTDYRFNSFMREFVDQLPLDNRPLRVISFTRDTGASQIKPLDFDEEISNFNKTLNGLSDVDLAITSIGVNGHIAYNEMGTPFYSKSRIVDLHKSTLEHRLLGYTRAYTVGVADILKAERVVTIGISDIDGQDKDISDKRLKTSAVNKALFTFNVTASYVRMKNNSNFLFILDAETAGEDLFWIKFGQTLKTRKINTSEWKGLNGHYVCDEDENFLSSYTQAVKEFYDHLMVAPYNSETDTKSIIIGIDKGWIPVGEQYVKVLNQISRIRLRGVEIFIGEGKDLAEIMARRSIEKGSENVKIILLGNPEQYKNGGYRSLMGEGIKKGLFVALMDGHNLKDITNDARASYIMLMKWIEGAVKMAFSDKPDLIGVAGLEKLPEEIGPGIWMLVPRANLMDIGTLTKIYQRERDVLKNL